MNSIHHSFLLKVAPSDMGICSPGNALSESRRPLSGSEKPDFGQLCLVQWHEDGESTEETNCLLRPLDERRLENLVLDSPIGHVQGLAHTTHLLRKLAEKK